MRFLLVLALIALSVAGCRKKSSPEFFKFEADHSILVAREGEDAYVSPEMDVILAGLQAVPAEAIEKPRAETLAAKILAEKTRLTASRVVKPTPPPVDPFAGRLTGTGSSPVEPAPDSTPETDAGDLPPPSTGLDLATFLQRYGRCFTEGAPTQLPNGVAATTQVLKSGADCQKLGTAGATTLYLFVDGKVWGKATQTETVVVVDAGPPPAKPAPPPPPDAGEGETMLQIQGAPQPAAVPAP